MSLISKEQLRGAVEYLTHCTQYQKQVDQLRTIIAEWDEKRVAFSGVRKPLNALVQLGLVSQERFDKAIALVAAQRKDTPRARRVGYQREYMRQSRARMHKALALEQEITGHRLGRDVRVMRSKKIREGWMQRRDEILSEFPEMGWEEKHALIKAFWAEVDAELDTLIAKINNGGEK